MNAVGRTVFLSLGYTWRETHGNYYQEPDRRKWVNAAHPRAVNGPDLEPGRVECTHLLLQFIRVRKGVVAEIYVALQGKRELAIDKPSRGSWFMVEPVKYGFEWIQALIEGEHRFRGKTVVMYRHLRWRGSVLIVSYASRTLERDAMVAGWGQPSEL